MTTDTHLSQLIRLIEGDKATDDILATLQIDRAFILESAGAAVSRGVFAMALNALLFHDLLGASPRAQPTSPIVVANANASLSIMAPCVPFGSAPETPARCRRVWNLSRESWSRSATTWPESIRSTNCA
jgi:hypothetical protein